MSTSCAPKRSAWRSCAANAIEESFDIGLALGDHAALVGRMQRVVDDYPLRERLAGQLMMALYRVGRQAEALRVYTQLRERLGDELGIEPDVALSRLETAIIRHEPELELEHELDARGRSAAGTAPPRAGSRAPAEPPLCSSQVPRSMPTWRLPTASRSRGRPRAKSGSRSRPARMQCVARRSCSAATTGRPSASAWATGPTPMHPR